MSLTLFRALQEQHQKSKYDAYWRMGQVCSILTNIHRGKGSKTFVPTDFIPDMFGDSKKDAAKKPVVTASQLKDQIRGLNKALAGKVVKPKKKEVEVK